MKLTLLIMLILCFVLFQQVEQVPDLVVLKFHCGRNVTRNSVVRSVDDPDSGMNEPITLRQGNQNAPQRVINRQDIQQRGAELRATEANAALSSQAGLTTYYYQIQVRNTGSKPVKSFAWQYQSGAETSPSDRQFYCVINAKSNDKKELELLSPLAPSRVVDAKSLGDKSNKDLKEKVLVNRIEYADGSVWQRTGWNPQTFGSEDTKKVSSGKCIGI